MIVKKRDKDMWPGDYKRWAYTPVTLNNGDTVWREWVYYSPRGPFQGEDKYSEAEYRAERAAVALWAGWLDEQVMKTSKAFKEIIPG